MRVVYLVDRTDPLESEWVAMQHVRALLEVGVDAEMLVIGATGNEATDREELVRRAAGRVDATVAGGATAMRAARHVGAEVIARLGIVEDPGLGVQPEAADDEEPTPVATCLAASPLLVEVLQQRAYEHGTEESCVWIPTPAVPCAAGERPRGGPLPVLLSPTPSRAREDGSWARVALLPLLDESPPVEIVLLARDGRRPALEEIVEVARGDGLVVGTWRESAGLDVVALQALACGRAAVLGDGPAYRDLDPRRRASLAVPAGDAGALRAAVRALRDDPALRARLGEEGRRLASSPTLHRCGELLVEVLSAAQKRQTLLDAWHRAPWPAAPSDRGDDGDDARRHQWEVEQELARRLRRATPTERRQLYSLAYDELFRRVPKQPQLEQARDHAARSALVDLQLRLVAPFVGPSTVFLEIGAGDCAFARALCPRVRRVHAVEASRAIEQNGSGDAPPNLHFAVADLPPLPVADDSVDVAYSSHVVEHLHPDDLAPHLEDVLRILVPGGLYLCVTPNRLLGPHDVSRYFADRACGLHLREYTHHELGRAMHRAGFTPVRALRRLGDEPARGRLAVVELVERALALAPARLRRRLLSGVGRREPFRPLEQVKLVAWKPAR